MPVGVNVSMNVFQCLLGRAPARCALAQAKRFRKWMNARLSNVMVILSEEETSIGHFLESACVTNIFGILLYCQKMETLLLLLLFIFFFNFGHSFGLHQDSYFDNEYFYKLLQ